MFNLKLLVRLIISITLIVLIYGALGLLSAGRNTLLDVELLLLDKKVTYTISNSSNESIRINDQGLIDRTLPSSIQIRVLDSDENVLNNQIDTEQGWWTPKFLESQLILGNQEFFEIKARRKFKGEIPIEHLLAGIRIADDGKAVNFCFLQVRGMIINHKGIVLAEQYSKKRRFNCEDLHVVTWT